jgi:dTDP-4-amino-4,6-dideoxygalactose transaminase
MTSRTVTTLNVPFFRYPHVFMQQREDVLAAMEAVLQRGAFILQDELAQFEATLASYLKIGHVVGVANGTDALLLALRAAEIHSGDEVILPSHTYVATAAAVHFVGAVPVLVDCGADHLVDVAAVEAAITPRTRAVIPVHLNGRTCEMDGLRRVATRYNLALVEDAAQALGARYKGRYAGTFGIAAGFSFYPAKVLGCFGDGGAVSADEPEVAQRLRMLRDHGRDGAGDVSGWGLNSRLDTLQAAVLNVKFRCLQRELERRREIARSYQEQLRELDGLFLPPGPDDDPDRYDVYQNYEIDAVRRDALRAHLKARGVETVVQWGGKAVHQFSALGCGRVLPHTERVFERCFLLPMNTSLTDDEVHYIGDVVREFYVG